MIPLVLVGLLLQQADVYKGARVVVAPGREVPKGVLVVRDGRIAEEAPPGARIHELPPTAWIVPGIVDPHSHLGSWFDVEEPTESVTPHVKAVDGFSSAHPDVRAALASGVTTVALAPGNGNVVGGRMGLVRLNGARFDQALLKDVAALKIALGSEAFHRDREPTSRAGGLRMLREFFRAPPPEAKGLRVFAHASTAAEIQAALELEREFKLGLVLVHARAAGRLVEEIRAAGVPVILGPLTAEEPRDVLEAPGRLARAGVPIAFASDAPRTSEAQLRQAAAFAVRHGLDPAAALRALTATPASLLGLSDRLGTLEPGRDADFVVYSGHPLSLASAVERVVVGGREVYRRAP